MSEGAVDSLVAQWRRMPTEFAPGLVEAEIEHIEQRYKFEFPPDLRQCLAATLPVGTGFPDWRAGTQSVHRWDGEIVTTPLSGVVAWPIEGVLFDVEFNGMWRDEFGPRPDSIAAARDAATAYLKTVPRLIPVFVHRYLPESPSGPGNPIFSVHQSDVIYYGTDLSDCLLREFGPRPASLNLGVGTRHVPFWSNLAEGR